MSFQDEYDYTAEPSYQDDTSAYAYDNSFTKPGRAQNRRANKSTRKDSAVKKTNRGRVHSDYTAYHDQYW